MPRTKTITDNPNDFTAPPSLYASAVRRAAPILHALRQLDDSPFFMGEITASSRRVRVGSHEFRPDWLVRCRPGGDGGHQYVGQLALTWRDPFTNIILVPGGMYPVPGCPMCIIDNSAPPAQRWNAERAVRHVSHMGAAAMYALPDDPPTWKFSIGGNSSTELPGETPMLSWEPDVVNGIVDADFLRNRLNMVDDGGRLYMIEDAMLPGRADNWTGAIRREAPRCG